ncbi:Sodium/hydrogen_exchanger [Hexamita inflata]|uniref:Sodium/hydrogen exchanger n=1 Tax=Hexamita inflata TaxID=28002 RepID=A0AA86RKC9_9EUKA|nr:Sodium/hydrogen exchanger [Hexamita inflata]
MSEEFEIFGWDMTKTKATIIFICILLIVTSLIRLLYSGSKFSKFLPESALLVLIGIVVGEHFNRVWSGIGKNGKSQLNMSQQAKQTPKFQDKNREQNFEFYDFLTFKSFTTTVLNLRALTILTNCCTIIAVLQYMIPVIIFQREYSEILNRLQIHQVFLQHTAQQYFWNIGYVSLYTSLLQFKIKTV